MLKGIKKSATDKKVASSQLCVCVFNRHPSACFMGLNNIFLIFAPCKVEEVNIWKQKNRKKRWVLAAP